VCTPTFAAGRSTSRSGEAVGTTVNECSTRSLRGRTAGEPQRPVPFGTSAGRSENVSRPAGLALYLHHSSCGRCEPFSSVPS